MSIAIGAGLAVLKEGVSFVLKNWQFILAGLVLAFAYYTYKSALEDAYQRGYQKAIIENQKLEDKHAEKIATLKEKLETDYRAKLREQASRAQARIDSIAVERRAADKRVVGLRQQLKAYTGRAKHSIRAAAAVGKASQQGQDALDLLAELLAGREADITQVAAFADEAHQRSENCNTHFNTTISLYERALQSCKRPAAQPIR